MTGEGGPRARRKRRGQASEESWNGIPHRSLLRAAVTTRIKNLPLRLGRCLGDDILTGSIPSGLVLSECALAEYRTMESHFDDVIAR